MSQKILVIEDEDETLSFLDVLLQAAGFEVLKASSAAEGLNLARQVQPDLVLLDIILPEMDGWEVSERLRQIAHIPIIFVTALRDEQNQSKGLVLGDDYIIKPFDPRELIERVRAQIRPDVSTDAKPEGGAAEPEI